MERIWLKERLAWIEDDDLGVLELHAWFTYNGCRVFMAKAGQTTPLWEQSGPPQVFWEWWKRGGETMAKSLLERLADQLKEQGPQAGVVDAGSRKRYPGLVELLTEARLPNGGARELATISIRWADGTWKVAVNEPNIRASLWATGTALDACLDAIESRLQGEAPDWRTWRPEGNQKPRKGRG